MPSQYCCQSCEAGNPCESSFKPSGGSSLNSKPSVPNLPLNPLSGLYINQRGELDINCAVLGNRCTWPVSTGGAELLNYTWTVSPSSMTVGGQVTINVSGLTPFSSITFRIVPSSGEEFYVAGQADGTGNVVNKKIRLDIEDTQYVFTTIYPGGVPNISSYAVNVLACGETVECSCLGAVTLKPVLSSYSVVSGQQVTLQILASNSNTCPISNLDMPALVLPPEISGGSASIADAIVNGKSTRIFEFPLQVQNTSGQPKTINITIPSGSATFECNGISYSAGGGTVALTIAPATGSYCGLAVTNFAFTPASVPDNTSANLAITVQNIGSVDVTNLTMPNLNLADSGVSISAGATVIGFPAVPLLAAGATHTVNVDVTFQRIGALPHSHNVICPAGQIYATCNGSLITTNVASNATLTLT